jgi:hypothetical protein
MDEARVDRVVAALRARGVFAHVKPAQAGLTACGVRVVLADGREAVWDTDGAAGLEAQILRNGVLVGYVPSIGGSENFDEALIVDAIARADYDAPAGRAARRPADDPGRSRAPSYPAGYPARQPTSASALLRRLRDGFRP